MTRPEIRLSLGPIAIALALLLQGGGLTHAAPADTSTIRAVATAATDGSFRLAQNGELRRKQPITPDGGGVRGGDGGTVQNRSGGEARKRQSDGETAPNRGGGRHDMRPRRRDGGGHRADRRRRRGHDGGVGIYVYPFTLYDYDPYYYNHGPYYRPYYHGRLSCETVRRMVEDAGYRRVRSDDCRGRIYGYFARRGKRNYYVNASAYTGRIVSVYRR